ncbi:MAG: ABC transporter substrate-binding protein [Promethearchaeota archaeon]
MIVCVAGGLLGGWFIPSPITAPSSRLVDLIKQRGKLIVGTSADYPPFEFWNLTKIPNEIEGFDIDLSQLIADALGVTLEMTDISFDALIGSCQAGTIDMIAAAMTYDPTTEVGQQRAKQLAPSIPYISVAQVVIVVDSSPLTTIDSLDNLTGSGLNIGCQSGTVMQAELALISGITVTAFSSAILLIQDLVSGTGIDAAYVDEPIFDAWNATYSLRVILTTGTDPLSLWCRHENPDLLYIINTAILDASVPNGTLFEIIDKWFG